MIHLGQDQAKQTRSLIILTGLATTFILWTPLADPINLPKMFALTIFSSWVLGSVLMGVWATRGKGFSLGQWAVVVFALGMLLAALFTDVKYTAFFGALQRNDGALSYFALAILSLGAMMSFTSSNLGQIRTTLLWVGVVLTGYGFLQTSHRDPIHWNLAYNPVIGTLGNPDFASAMIGVCAIATLWFLLSNKRIWIRGAASVLILLELFIVKRSGSSQGLFIIGFGFSILVVTEIWHRNKKAGWFSLGLVGIGSIPILLGIVNTGPLAARIYRSSIRSRIDYWHAALDMFKAHPIIGVGLDRFGDNYGHYAPQIQVAQDQYTNNAHNVFLQLLATGGLLVILPYLFLLVVIFYTAIRGIKKFAGQNQRDLIALFSIWSGLFFVSFISIDNLGVVVWFWILGGALYGVVHRYSMDERKSIAKQKRATPAKKGVSSDSSNIISPILSLFLAIIMLFVMVPAWESSRQLLVLRGYSGGLSQAQFNDEVRKAAEVQPGDSQVHIGLADVALRASAVDLGLELTKTIIKQDPKSANGNYLSAIANEMAHNYQAAISFRKRLLELDRWNTGNMLILVRDYVLAKDLGNAKAIAARIQTLRPNGGDAKAAEAAIKG